MFRPINILLRIGVAGNKFSVVFFFQRRLGNWNYPTIIEIIDTRFRLCQQEAEEAAIAKQNKLEAQAAARDAAAAAAIAAEQIVKSPSDFSCHSYELFVGQEKGNDDNNKEKMSIRSIESASDQRHKQINNNHSAANKVRKVSAVSIRLADCTNPTFIPRRFDVM